MAGKGTGNPHVDLDLERWSLLWCVSCGDARISRWHPGYSRPCIISTAQIWKEKNPTDCLCSAEQHMILVRSSLPSNANLGLQSCDDAMSEWESAFTFLQGASLRHPTSLPASRSQLLFISLMDQEMHWQWHFKGTRSLAQSPFEQDSTRALLSWIFVASIIVRMWVIENGVVVGLVFRVWRWRYGRRSSLITRVTYGWFNFGIWQVRSISIKFLRAYICA
jgi:hypothetical protein